MGDSKRLTAIKVAKLREPGRYGDGAGLWLQIAAGGTKSWLLRYQRDGRARQMGLGPVDLVSLAEARERARDARRLLLNGQDPIEARRSARMAMRLEAARGITFQECAERYVAAHEAAWRNEKHRDQWRSTLSRYCYPVLGVLPVAAVNTALVMKILEPIWMSRPETAGRVRGRIETVLDWATARQYRQGENPARWRGHIDKLLPPRSKVRRVQHHRAVPYLQIPRFMSDLRAREGISARALEFTVLTAARTSETIGAQWSEIDENTRVWIVPGERMKSGREHRVPLCDRSLELLQSLPRERDAEHIFPGARAKQPLSNMAMLELIRDMQGLGATVHGFRSSFRDWAAERTNYPREIAEAALAHVVGDKTEAAYRRGDALEKRRRLMRDWAKFCASPPEAVGTVVPLQMTGAA